MTVSMRIRLVTGERARTGSVNNRVSRTVFLTVKDDGLWSNACGRRFISPHTTFGHLVIDYRAQFTAMVILSRNENKTYVDSSIHIMRTIKEFRPKT